MGGRDQSERLVAINRNRWSQSAGAPKLIEAALEKASIAASVAEAEVAKALGFELCKCQFPPIPMLTVGHIDQRGVKLFGPVYECPKCGFNSAGYWNYNRIAPPRTTTAGPAAG
jgi:hypothetical protein